jgi:hypothetical protein
MAIRFCPPAAYCTSAKEERQKQAIDLCETFQPFLVKADRGQAVEIDVSVHNFDGVIDDVIFQL